MTMASSRGGPRHSWSTRAGLRLLWTYGFILLNVDFVRAACGVTFLYPTQDLTFNYLDTINVTYQSNFSRPALYTFCWGTGNTKPVQKALEPNAPGFNASLLIRLNFKSPDDCWFDLKPNTPDCGENSPHFTLIPTPASQATIGLDQPPTTSAATNPTNTAVSDSADTTAVTSESGNGGMSTGAQVGLGIGLAVVVGIVAGGLAVFFWQRRRRPRSLQDTSSKSIVNNIFRRRQGEKPQPLLHPGWGQSLPGGHGQTGKSGLPPKHMHADDAYLVGWSEALPGFYGSARESGSRHDISAPLATHHADSGATSLAASSFETPHHANTPIPSYHAATPIEYYNAEYYPPEKNRPSPSRVEETQGASAELPGAHAYRGYGQEFELPTQQQPQPYFPVGREQEQKFLLDDMELMGLKKQKRRASGQGTSS